MATSKAPSLPEDPTRDDRIMLYGERADDNCDIFTGEPRDVPDNAEDRMRKAHQLRKAKRKAS
jgi:hypothetical protein